MDRRPLASEAAMSASLNIPGRTGGYPHYNPVLALPGLPALFPVRPIFGQYDPVDLSGAAK